MPFDDEIPQAPAGSVDEVPFGQEAQFDTSIDASLFDEVPRMGDPVPAGTYHFRLEKYEKRMTEEGQPYFALQWNGQQEPIVGRKVFENVPWILPEDAKDAADPSSVRRAEARKILNNRLPKAKEIMEAAAFKPTGQFGFEQFLASNPEMKLVVKVKERQSATGRMVEGKGGKQVKEYKGTGEMGNDVVKHLSLHRPQ